MLVYQRVFVRSQFRCLPRFQRYHVRLSFKRRRVGWARIFVRFWGKVAEDNMGFNGVKGSPTGHHRFFAKKTSQDYTIYIMYEQTSSELWIFTGLEGSRITLEHSLKLHFGTQHDTYHQSNANHTDMRFTDRRNTLKAWRVPKRGQDQKKASYKKYTP